MQSGDDLDLVLTIPVDVPCVVRFPAIPCADQVLRPTWRDERGEVACEGFGSNDPCPTFDVPLRIAPGRYAISVTEGADRTATTTAEARPGGSANVIVLPLPGEPRK